ncbi:MAG: DUF1232 domain-containing protein [Polyangiales bacterium]
MSDVDAKCLDVFPTWLRTLGDDGEGLVDLISDPKIPETARRTLVGGLNYLFKSLDLIPDGIDDIGYLDDAFVLRVAADLANKEGIDNIEAGKLTVALRLVNEVDLVKEFLGDDYKRLESYVVGLRRGAARGRSVDDIVNNPSVLAEFIADVRGFAKSYTAPSFSREPKNLIKMRAFFDAKLPR